MIYLKLFYVFFSIGLFSIGGGMATLPLLQKAVEKYNWMTENEFFNMIAISESTPGPIGINMSTYVGYNTGGVFGGICATLGIVTPSLIIILIICHYFMRFNENPIVKSAFFTLRPAVTGLIAAAGYSVLRISIFNFKLYEKTREVINLIDIKGLILFIALLILSNKYKKHPIFYIVIAGIIGFIFKF